MQIEAADIKGQFRVQLPKKLRMCSALLARASAASPSPRSRSSTSLGAGLVSRRQMEV